MKDIQTSNEGFRDWLCNHSPFASERDTVMADFVYDVRRDDEYPHIESSNLNEVLSVCAEHERLERYFRFRAGMCGNPAVYRCFVKAWKEYIKQRR